MIQDEILAYIPQRPPFVMIDELISADEKVSKTSFIIRENNLLVKNGRFTEGGLVENMAQTGAAGTCYRIRHEGKPAPVGYIGGLKNLSVSRLPAVGEQIITEVSFVHKILNVHIVQGRVFADGEEIAACELKIFQQV